MSLLMQVNTMLVMLVMCICEFTIKVLVRAKVLCYVSLLPRHKVIDFSLV